jgi:hypothetical protein
MVYAVPLESKAPTYKQGVECTAHHTGNPISDTSTIVALSAAVYQVTIHGRRILD